MRISHFTYTVIFSIFLLINGVCASSYILTFNEPSGDVIVPTSFMDDLKSIIKEFGGKVTHEYTLIRGFTIDMSSSNISGLKSRLTTIGNEFGYSFNIEQDSDVHAIANH
ncbi:hypothetical protein TPHA_0F02110 [Tetrapisispora phaffii CBS 4417]|uniref:Inhibitor I9 domain-containing protein n=1 Tax=Tetrapisispora phaffii (strain ATCC 24235 / CBS 4417 / NBRC 1672 / NRRL Y-8282 / UCD 70-5) TaxID=1071381 RepID=G8BVB1_TETPH|nr:hypothetical protein TPHA_0F02110 [Tetrapisispora phaffii CBS 4417]CCE63693.1 hypothetical protein TPHA_0F02110 [Tetrapisispora phaffii CBS 4417]